MRRIATAAAATAAIGVGALAFFAAFAAAAVDSQTATVILHVPTHHVSAYADLTGSETGGDLPTRHITAEVTESGAGTSSAVTLTTYATGTVVFSFYNGCTRECAGSIRIPVGFDVATAAGVHYLTQAEALFPFLTSSRPIPVTAAYPGPAGNAAAGTVTVINKAGDLTVTNPQPITGGTSRTTHLILQRDYDKAAADLETRVLTDAQYVLGTNGRDLNYEWDSPPSYIVVSDHAVGDESPTFTLTASVSLSAHGFSDTTARQLLQARLTSQLAPGESLVPGTIRTNYSVLNVSQDGEVEVIGEADGTAIPAVNAQVLRQVIASLSPAEARTFLEGAVPGSRVDIRMGLPQLSRLPANPDHINLVVVAR